MSFWNRVLNGTVAVLLAAGWVVPDAEGKMKQEQNRSDVAERYKWDLTTIYVDEQAWEADLARVREQVVQLGACKGTLGNSAESLADCLDLYFDVQKRLYRVYSYASRLYHIDMADPKAQAANDKVSRLATEVDEGASFLAPELLAIPAEKLAGFTGSQRMKDYRVFVSNVTRRRDHIRNAEVEATMAASGDMASVAQQSFSTLTTVSIPYPEVALKDGTRTQLNQAAYGALRALPDRDDRKLVFEKFWENFRQYVDTLANLLSGKISVDRFSSKMRGYSGDLEASLDATDVPVELYHNMIAQVRAARPVLWRYLDLRKKMLGLENLEYYDLYTSIVADADFDYPFEEAEKLIVEAVEPLGAPYVKVIKEAFAGRWMDVYPSKGKRTGAYSSGAVYGVHPYVLLNYTDDYNSMSTTAHELGHALHSYLSNGHQPFAMADYPTFVAEVASTVNENLLRLHLVKKETDRNKRLFLLSQALENFRTTVFRQALFAEFELRVHQMAWEGTPLTAETLNETYLALLKEYYGEVEGHIHIDALYGAEWSYVPHFYYNFYMFQYTTSFIAATAIAQSLFEGREGMRRNYLEMLSAGGSRSPVDLLKMAGMEMSGADPYETAFRSMNEVMDEMEKLID